MATSTNNPPLNPVMNDSNGRTTAASHAQNGTSFPDHKRAPSMTVTPAGATKYGAPQNTANIQFGSVNNGANAAVSPAPANPQSVHQSNNSLGLNNFTAHSNSPSPVPQPAQVSGGRPPSGMSGAPIAMNFGRLEGATSDTNGLTNSLSQMSIGAQDHIRRGSTQSNQTTDFSAPPNAPRGGFTHRGRAHYSGYNNNNNGFQPGNNFQSRGGYRGNRGGHNAAQYHGSPSLQHRQMASPGTPTMQQMQMNMPQAYPYSYSAYGNIPIVPDPSISYNAQQQYYNQYQQSFGYPPQSPQPGYRNPNYSAPSMPPAYGGQAGQGPSSMSRQSSQMSAADRPGSSMGQTPSTTASTSHHPSGRTASVSSEIQRPAKRSAAIVIKNLHGEVVDFKKSTPAITPAVPATNPSPSPTPSRTGSAFEAAHSQTASQSTPVDSTDKSKAMKEAVARRIAENEEKEKAEAAEAEGLQKAKEAAEEKARMDEEAKQAAAREAEEKRIAAEKAEQEAARAAEELKQREEEEARAADEKAKADQAAQAAQVVPESSKPADDGEMDFDALAAEMEAEEAAREAEELRKEEEYNKRKAAQREAQRKKEQEEAEEYERTMKEAEKKAEEEEAAREKKREQGDDSDDVEARKMFDTLKAGGTLTPQTDEEGAAKPTPGGSGVATPVSDLSMGPPKARRSRAAELTLDTKKTVEPSEPSATLKSLNSARLLDDLSKVSYPSGFVSPNPALNSNAPADKKFKYDKEFLLQFQPVFKEKPSLDWDQKIRDVFGDGDSARPQTARTPSTMGGRSASNRGPSNTVFGGPMGSLGGARPLPPGTTSEQRFAASNAARGGMNNAFAMGRGMGIGGRTPSNNPLGIPGSPRVGGSARGASRVESKRGKQGGKQEHEQNKAMPLTAGLDVGSLQTSSTGWKPRSLGTGAGNASVGLDGYMEADVVQRKVKAALNKMTPENFDRISQQILGIAAQSKSETDGRTLRQVIQLVFEKATDEAHWASMYAKFCAEMLMNMSSDIKDEGIKDKNGQVVTGGNLFRKYLLNRCQEEFEKGWKVNLPEPKEGESKEVTMLSDEYYEAAAAKRRGLGLVKFIGELFKLNMLTERIMHECVKKLLDYKGTPDEAEVESLCSLLRTIGKQIDSPESRVAGAVDMYFDRIHQTMNLPDLPSRMRYMLLDIIDLRKAGWVSKDADKGPKTIQQIHEEAEAAKQRDELARLASQANARGGGRLPMGRGDARSFSYNQGPPPDTSGRVNTDDLRRLNNRVKSSVPTGSFGPSGLGARTNSGRRGLGPALNRAEEGNATSRTGTPPAQKEAKKDESSQNAFSALAALEGAEMPTSPPSNPASPATTKADVARERSRSPEKTT